MNERDTTGRMTDALLDHLVKRICPPGWCVDEEVRKEWHTSTVTHLRECMSRLQLLTTMLQVSTVTSNHVIAVLHEVPLRVVKCEPNLIDMIPLVSRVAVTEQAVTLLNMALVWRLERLLRQSMDRCRLARKRRISLLETNGMEDVPLVSLHFRLIPTLVSFGTTEWSTFDLEVSQQVTHFLNLLAYELLSISRPFPATQFRNSTYLLLPEDWIWARTTQVHLSTQSVRKMATHLSDSNLTWLTFVMARVASYIVDALHATSGDLHEALHFHDPHLSQLCDRLRVYVVS